jgi:hypothetical protein
MGLVYVSCTIYRRGAMREVLIKCAGATSLALDTIHDFQGSLKDLSIENYEKLKNVILRHGYSEPISVWKDPKTEKYMCLNGHQRLRTLKLLQKDGYSVPKLPVSIVDAKDMKEAKEKVLTLTSQYGEITQQGLYEFMAEAGTDWEWAKESLRLPEIDLAHFEAGFMGVLSASDGSAKPALLSMRDKFLIPPFSILNAREGWWQDRKRQWLAIGIQSELGRGGNP